MNEPKNQEASADQTDLAAALPAPLVLRAADGATAVIHPHGAQVTSWIPTGGGERLFLSSKADYSPQAAIRGGIPVIFPQFANEGPLPKHGFARTRPWTLIDHGVDAEGRGCASFLLVDDEASRTLWPQAFRAELRVIVIGASLAMTLTIENSGSGSFAFTAALHSYLAVADIAGTEVHGLQYLRYRDSAAGGRERVEASAVQRFDGEFDRIYFDAPASLTLRSAKQVLLSQSTGFTDAVVWNPGAARAAGFSDLAPGDWQRFVCVEPATIGQPVRLAAGERWEGSQTLTVRPEGV